jgi:hypothetical protein
MHSQNLPPSRLIRLAIGFTAGALIAAVDTLAFHGEVSPIVIVLLLLGATAAFGVFWGSGSWVASGLAWAWLPSAHLVKRLLGLADTLHPNTWKSLLLLAAFTLAVAALGTAAGLVVHRLNMDSQRPPQPRV